MPLSECTEMSKLSVSMSQNQRHRGWMSLCAAFWSVAPTLPSCQLAFGEYEIGDGTGGGADAIQGSATSTGGPTSIAGTKSSGGSTNATTGYSGGLASSGGTGSAGSSAPIDCNGTSPYRCLNAELQACINGVWTTKQTCHRLALCQPAVGVCDFCANGDLNCNGPVLSVCNTARTGFVQTTCVSPLYCDATINYCIACTFNQARCSVSTSDSLDICNSDRTGWDLQAASCNGLGCHATDGKNDYCNDCTAANLPLCASSALLRSCVSGKWKTSNCATGCATGTASTPASCF